jgi:hypothetical protein
LEVIAGNFPEYTLAAYLGAFHAFPGLFSLIFWEQGFDKVCESSRTLELFKQFDVQFRKWRILLVFMVILVQNMLVLSNMYIIYYVNECRKNFDNHLRLLSAFKAAILD